FCLFLPYFSFSDMPPAEIYTLSLHDALPIYAAETFYEAELTAIQEPDPDHPGLYDQPYKGVQYMGIPEFQDFGTRASQEFSDVIAGNTSPEQALQESQKIVEEGTSRYREE